MTLIIRVDRTQTAQTCVKLETLCGRQLIPIVRDECGRARLDAYIIVRRAGCRDIKPAVKVWCGCRYIEVEPEKDMSPAIKYKGWELDEEGRVCFYWDDLMLEQKNGRYDVELFVCDEQSAHFQIDLRSKVRVTEVVNRQARACANC